MISELSQEIKARNLVVVVVVYAFNPPPSQWKVNGEYRSPSTEGRYPLCSVSHAGKRTQTHTHNRALGPAAPRWES